ncbi:MAG: hypothetical protein SH856_02080 [Flavobacteriales bacterium]|nr:hypothetical protein [Flavobacteriales bacterium]
MKATLVIFLVIVCAQFCKPQGVVIHEVCSKNSETVFDLNEDTPDFIELKNNSGNAVNLDG